MTRYCIIGNGIAANAAAEQIRTRDTDGAITMFTREDHFFYYTPALPDYLAGERDAGAITIHDEAWYRKQDIRLVRACTIESIDPGAHRLTDANGGTWDYDTLLLATGGHSFVPPIAGADSPGVFTLRSLDDADRIRTAASGARSMVLIGGGLLGLEAGNGLRRAGLQVTVVEFFPRLLPRQMDTAGAALLQKTMEAMGFSFRLGAKTKAIVPRDSDLCVTLESGEELPADLVLVSAGVRPETGLARGLGLEIDKGVKVTNSMETALPGVYAAGDLIEHHGRYYGIWPAAAAQGTVAGAGMAGDRQSYSGTVPANTLKVVGIDLTAAGEIDAEGTRESIVAQDPDTPFYRKLVIENDTIVGTILYGDIRGSSEILSAIEKKTDISAHRAALAQADFDFTRLGG